MCCIFLTQGTIYRGPKPPNHKREDSSMPVFFMTVQPCKHQTGLHTQKRGFFEFDCFFCVWVSLHPESIHEYGVGEPRWDRQAGIFSSLKATSDEVLVGGLEWILGGTAMLAFFKNVALMSLERSYVKFIVFALQRQKMDKYFWRIHVRKRGFSPKCGFVAVLEDFSYFFILQQQCKYSEGFESTVLLSLAQSIKKL